MKTCLKCGTQNTQDREFCITCGEPLGVKQASPEQPKEERMRPEDLTPPRRIWPTFFWLLPILVVYIGSLILKSVYYATYDDIWEILYNICRIAVWPVTLVVFIAAFVIMFGICLFKRLRYNAQMKDLLEAERRYAEAERLAEIQKAEAEAKAQEEAERGGEREALFLPSGSSKAADWDHEDEAAPVILRSYDELLAVDSALSRGLAPEYDQEISLKALISDFCAYAGERGLHVHPRVAGALFGTMGASRLIWILDKRRDLTQTFLELLASYFGTELHLHEAGEKWSSQAGLMVAQDPSSKAKKASGLFIDLYAANYRENTICISAVDHVDSSKATGSYFECLVEYARHPERPIGIFVPQITMGKNPRYIQRSVMSLSKNLWIMLRVEDGKNLSKLPEDSMVVDLSELREAEKKDVENSSERAVLSYNHFKELMESARSESYISEEYWKKLDAFEDYMSQRLNYSLSNRTIQQIESYAAVCLMENTDVYDILDAVVAYKMLPELAECQKDLLTGENDGLISALERIFGLDNMPVSLRTVKQMGLV